MFILFLSYSTEFPCRASTWLVLHACMNTFWNACNNCFYSAQPFLMFPQFLPVLTCLERSSSPDSVLADSPTTSSKLPNSSRFHLPDPPVSQSSPGDVAKWQVFSSLGQQPSVSLLAESQQRWHLIWQDWFVPWVKWNVPWLLYTRKFGRQFPPMLLECLIHIWIEASDVVYNRSSPRASYHSSKMQIQCFKAESRKG